MGTETLIDAACDVLVLMATAERSIPADKAMTKLAMEIMDWADPDDLTPERRDAVMAFGVASEVV
jgi:hypothetical protein